MCQSTVYEASMATLQVAGRKSLVKNVVVSMLCLAIIAFAALYAVNTGFRRSVRFWSSAAPLIAEYQVLKLWSRHVQGHAPITVDTVAQSLPPLIQDYHKRTAPKVVDLILRLGGIYVKFGQFLGSIGGALLEDVYVHALQPLQDGLPPRSATEMQGILRRAGLEETTLRDIDWDHPIGAASIAQAHTGIWTCTGEKVLVKIQYPEVATLYEADFDNLERVVQWLQPDQLPTVRSFRQRHVDELDFRTEARHLQEISANMVHHDLEPKVVRIPRVLFSSQHVLVMEYLEGVSLKEALHQEQEMIAKALGMESVSDLRERMRDHLKQHFQQGGGAIATTTTNSVFPQHHKNNNNMHIWMAVGAPIVRGYAHLRHQISNLGRRIAQQDVVPLAAARRFNLSKVLKTLVMVHGVQVLTDGVYNADPHPGNVLLLPDGRLGLIDYGMVGRLSIADRQKIATTVIGLHHCDVSKVVQTYRQSGYVTAWAGAPPDQHHEDAVVYRFATFHLDKIDLSPLVLPQAQQVWPVLELLQRSVERSTPDWMEQMKRIGCLLIGVASQAGRPISLASEWHGVAQKFLKKYPVQQETDTTDSNKKEAEGEKQ